MKLYRVMFETTLFVECADEKNALDLGMRFLREEVSNETSECVSIDELLEVDQLSADELRSLPYRDPSRVREGEATISDLLSKRKP